MADGAAANSDVLLVYSAQDGVTWSEYIVGLLRRIESLTVSVVETNDMGSAVPDHGHQQRDDRHHAHRVAVLPQLAHPQSRPDEPRRAGRTVSTERRPRRPVPLRHDARGLRRAGRLRGRAAARRAVPVRRALEHGRPRAVRGAAADTMRSAAASAEEAQDLDERQTAEEAAAAATAATRRGSPETAATKTDAENSTENGF